MNKILKRLLIILASLIILLTLPIIDLTGAEVTTTTYVIYYVVAVIIAGIILTFYFIGKNKDKKPQEEHQIKITPREIKEEFIDRIKKDPDYPDELINVQYEPITAGDTRNPTQIGMAKGTGHYSGDFYYAFVNMENPTMEGIKVISSVKKVLTDEEIREIANNMASKPQLKRQEKLTRYDKETGEVISEVTKEVTDATEEPKAEEETAIGEEN